MRTACDCLLGPLICLFGCVSGCVGDEELLAGRWVAQSSGAVTVYVHPGAEYCPAQVDHFDAYAANVAEELGVPPLSRIALYAATAELVDEFCQSSADIEGCALVSKGVAVSHGSFHHELVHLVANQDRPRALPLLSEGLAVYYSSMFAQCVEEPFDPLAWLTARDDLRMAHVFVGYLIEQFGIASVMALHEKSSVDLAPAEFDDLVEQAFGLRTSDIAAEMVAASYCARPDFSFLFRDRDRIAVEPGSVIERDASCQTDALGLVTNPVQVDILDVASGSYHLSAEGSGRFALQGWAPMFWLTKTELATSIFTAAIGGPAVLEVSGGSVDLTLSEAVLLDACQPDATTPPATIPAAHERIVLPEVGPVAVLLEFDEARTLEVSAGSDLSLCDAACKCSVLEDAIGTPLAVDRATPYWLVGTEDSSISRLVSLAAGGQGG
jgi:hypothetical protein